MAIDRDLGRRSPPMRSPGTIDDRARDIAPDGVPFNFYNRGPMDPPNRRFPIPMPMPNPFPDPRMPMPSPPPRDGLFPRPLPEFAVPLPSPPPGSIPPPGSVPPDMGPFREEPFGFDGGLIRPGKEKIRESQRNRSGIMSDLMDMNPDMTGFQMFAMPAAATIDPSDYRTIIKMIEQGLDPEDYMNRGGIASLLR